MAEEAQPVTEQPITSVASATPAPAPVEEAGDIAADMLAFEADLGIADESPIAAAAPVIEEKPVESAPVVAPAPPAPKHSLRVAAAARALGVPQSAIDSATPEQLEDFVIHRAFQPAPQQTPAAPVAEVDPLASYDFGIDETTKKKLTPADFDPNLMNVNRQLAKELRDVKAALNQRAIHEQRSAQQAVVNQVDDTFAELAATHKDKFSTARLGSVPEAELKLRDAILKASTMMPGRTHAERIKAAVETLYGKPVAPTPAEAKVTKTAEKWAAGAVAKPTSRKGATEPNGEAKARRSVRQFFANLGQQNDETSGDLSPEDLPD